jgi:hypothetical protein
MFGLAGVVVFFSILLSFWHDDLLLLLSQFVLGERRRSIRVGSIFAADGARYVFVRISVG